MKYPLDAQAIADFATALATTPRAQLIERAKREGLALGFRAAAAMTQHMIASAPDMRGRVAGPPPAPATRPAPLPQRVTVEVVTLDPSKVSKPRR